MDDETSVSRSQYACLVVVMGISSLISILGSMAVTRIAYLKLTSTYQRFLFVLSQLNILNSSFLLLHQLFLPQSEQFFWAFGSEMTCSMAGFFLHFGSLGVAMYSFFLSLYFYFSIHSSPKRDKLPEGIVGFWEWCAHIAAFLLPGGIALAAASSGNMDVAADGLGLCIIESYECVRGEVDQRDWCVPTTSNGWSIPKDTNALRWVYVVSMGAAAGASAVSTLLVYCRVHGTLNGDDSSLPEEMKQRLRAVATQSVLYTAAFLNTLIWPVLFVVVSTDDSPVYLLHLLAFMIYPLQGAFNCYIYIRPRYLMLRTMYPDDSMLVVARVSLSKAGDPDEIEEVRERIYGDSYEPPSVDSSVHSLASGVPQEVSFNPHSPLSKTSLVSIPGDDDEMDHEDCAQNEKPGLAKVDKDDGGEETDDAISS